MICAIIPYAEELSISDEFYTNLLQIFTNTDDAAMEKFVSDIAKLLKNNEFSAIISNIICNLEIYPVNNGHESYNNVIDLRKELQNLMDTSNDKINEWAKSNIEKNETLLPQSFESHTYKWRVDEWNLHEVGPTYSDRDGPELPIADFIKILNNVGVSWPDWLKVPVIADGSNKLIWKSSEELRGHIVKSSKTANSDDSDDKNILSEFEMQIKSKAIEFGLKEYYIPIEWCNYVGFDHYRLNILIKDTEELYKNRIDYLIKNTEDTNQLIYNLCVNFPQEKFQYPFFFIETNTQNVIVLEREIPESIMYQKEQVDEKYVVEYRKNNPRGKNPKDGFIRKIYPSVAKSLSYEDLEVTHLYYNDNNDFSVTFIQDLLKFNLTSKAGISVGFDDYTLIDVEFNPVCVDFPPNTSDEIKQQSLSSINKVPLIGNIFKIKPEHHSRIFDFEQPIPDNLRDRHSDGSARNIGDKYVVVGEKTEEIEDDDNISRINYGCIEPDFAKSLIGTTDYMESVLKTRPTFWDQQIESGKFSVLFRLLLFPPF